MYRGNGPRIFPIIVVIIVIALIIAALVSVARMVFFSGGDDTSKTTGDQKVNIRDEVLRTVDGRGVRYTVRGPIVADENFRSYQITVTPSSRSMTVYRGYLENPIETKTYDNNTRAYEQFVYALDKADIAKTRDTKEEDLRGVCANNGRAYKFEIMSDGDTKNSIWTSTCDGSKGTMAANMIQVHQLFANQIPDFTPVFDKTQ